MHISLFELFWEEDNKGIAVAYLSNGSIETALLGASVIKTPVGTILTGDLCFATLIYSTVVSFINLFKKEEDEDETKED